MKWQKTGLLALIVCSLQAPAQTKGPVNYRNFPVVLSIQFHSLSFPLKDLKTNFRNVGFGIGTEIALGSGPQWAQEFQFVWYHNQRAGNGILLYTQSDWRPAIATNVYAEIKIGFGYTYTFRPVESYRRQNGAWSSVGHEGKWIFTVPVGVGLGYSNYSDLIPYIAPLSLAALYTYLAL